MIVVVALGILLVAIIVFERRRPRVRIDHLPSVGGNPRVAFALARVEARKLVEAPTVLLGLAMFFLGGWVLGIQGIAVLPFDDWVLQLFLFPFAGMVILGVNLAMLRSSRSGTDELFASLPASRDVRTTAHLLSGWSVVALAIAMVGGEIAFLVARGAIGTADVGELLTGPMLVACAVAVGVTAARLVPTAAAGVLAVVAMGVFQGLVSLFAGQATRASWFPPMVSAPDPFPPGVWLRRPWSHLVYLAGLGLFAASLAFLRTRVSRRSLGVLGVSFAVIAAGGLAQSRPFTAAEYRQMATAIEQPSPRCEIHSTVSYCTPRGLEALVDHWRPPVESVLRALPPGVAGRPLRIAYRADASSLYRLPGRLRAMLSSDTPTREPLVWRPDGALHPNASWCASHGSCDLGLGVFTGAWAVGLPLDPTEIRVNPDDVFGDKQLGTYDSGGQARAVVALWLGARSTPHARSLFLRRLSAHEDPPFPLDHSYPLRVCDGIVSQGTAFSITDAHYAEQLLALPDETVVRMLRDRWATFADPATPSALIVRAFGLRAPASVGTLDFC